MRIPCTATKSSPRSPQLEKSLRAKKSKRIFIILGFFIKYYFFLVILTS